MSGYIGSTPVPQATQHRESFTATEGQTSFATAGYTPQFVDVYLNGSHLSPADFTATNGSDVVLGVGASADDVCDIISYTPFEVAGATFTGTTTMTDVVAASLDISGNIDIDGVTNLDVVDIDGAVDMASTLTVAGTLKIVDTELAEASDNFSINIQTGNNDFYVKSGGTIFAAFKGSPKDLQLTSGDLVFGTAGKGVVLGATTNTAANTLDDYEEGTWTPTVNRGYDAVGYSSQVGRYTKIGNTVRAFAQMTLAAGSTTGNSAGVRMIGLPFATNSNGGVYTVGFHYMNAIDSLGLESVWITFPNESAAYLYQKTATGVSVISGSTAGDDINVFLTMVYEAA